MDEEQEELSYWRRSAAQRLLSVTDYLADCGGLRLSIARCARAAR